MTTTEPHGVHGDGVDKEISKQKLFWLRLNRFIIVKLKIYEPFRPLCELGYVNIIIKIKFKIIIIVIKILIILIMMFTRMFYRYAFCAVEAVSYHSSGYGFRV